MKLEINLPYFEGFYNSPIDPAECLDIGEDENTCNITQENFDSINWVKTYANVGKEYLRLFIQENKESLDEYGIKIAFKSIYSPKYYNYSTDSLVCEVTFKSTIKSLLLRAIGKDGSEDYEYFNSIVYEDFTSYPGFSSNYSNDSEYWLRTLIKDIGNDNVVFETFLKFIIKDSYEKKFIFALMENAHEYLEYD